VRAARRDLLSLGAVFDAEVIVVGAGLAGLAAAGELHRHGRGVLVLEASDAVGGRVRTTPLDGYLLDRGFQVLLTAYPSAQQVLDLGTLDLAAFEPGVAVRTSGSFHLQPDPWKRPTELLELLGGGVGTPWDSVRLLRLRQRLRRGSVDELFEGLDETAAYRLRRIGFSPTMLDAYFRPLLATFTLEPDLSASAHVADFVLRMLSEGDMALPASGMGEIAAQLAACLPPGSIRLGAGVERLAAGEVAVDGQILRAEHVVVATDVTTATALVDGLEDPGWAGMTTLWFSAERPPTDSGRLLLNGAAEGLVTGAAVISNVAPSYAPVGHSLIAAFFPRTGIEGVEGRVRRELAHWWPDEDEPSTPVRDWDLLRVDEITRARPRRLPGFDAHAPVRLGSLVVAGDHCRTASIDGAIRAGLDAAAAVLAAPPGKPT
jgi:phytoene dehydrogenase-like protein